MNKAYDSVESLHNAHSSIEPMLYLAGPSQYTTPSLLVVSVKPIVDASLSTINQQSPHLRPGQKVPTGFPTPPFQVFGCVELGRSAFTNQVGRIIHPLGSKTLQSIFESLTQIRRR